MSRTVNTYDGPPPPGYIPGKGRGATGFVTRSDVGSSVVAKPADGEEKTRHGQFDTDEADEDADSIYRAIDERVAGKKRKAADAQVSDAHPKSKISDQFKELKSALGGVSAEEWAALPDVGDRSAKLKPRQAEIYTPVFDTLIASQAKAGATDKSIDAASAPIDPNAGNISSVATGISAARNTLISQTLSSISDSVSGQSVIDPKGYLTSLTSQTLTSTSDLGDIKKARLLLSSVCKTNPFHAPGWIAAARVEEFSNDMTAARNIIRNGCAKCPTSEDIWLEASRLSEPDVAKSILSSAIAKIPKSVKLYLAAADLEETPKGKRTVYRRALESVPNSVKLWKAAISLESIADAKVMLARAVECVPNSPDIWLALARLETYENARKVLNSARKANPLEVQIWIAAARLEEGQGNDASVDKVIAMAVTSLSQTSSVVKRSQWLVEAEQCEASSSIATATAIVNHAISLEVEDEDRQRTFVADAEAAIERGSTHTARAIFKYLLKLFPNKKNLWLKLVDLEKSKGTPTTLSATLSDAVAAVPKSEVLWLMHAKEKWVGGDIAGAREVLTSAFAANPNSEAVWLAGVKLEWENDEIARARALLARARERAGTDRVYMKSALLERETGDTKAALTLLKEGVAKYPKFVKFYLMGAQICWEDLKDAKKSREWVTRGLSQAETDVRLWIQSAKLEEEGGGGVGKARGVYELARLKVKSAPEGYDRAWLESVRLERRHGNTAGGDTLMAMALQECRSSGLLWSENIVGSKRVEQKSKSMDALKNCNDDCRVVCAVAQLFVSERKYDKARKWFMRATVLNPEFGDGWAMWYAFEKGQAGAGVEERLNDIVGKCVKAEPKYGDVWQSVSKATENRRKSVEERLTICVIQLMKASSSAL
jgi:pre-mRNA-processing factor 6